MRTEGLEATNTDGGDHIADVLDCAERWDSGDKLRGAGGVLLWGNNMYSPGLAKSDRLRLRVS